MMMKSNLLLSLAVVLLSISGASCFLHGVASTSTTGRAAQLSRQQTERSVVAAPGGGAEEVPTEHCDDRRTFLVQSASGLFMGSSLLLFPQASFAAAPPARVVVLGAGGRTGMEVVRALAKEGLSTVSMTRTGKDPFQVIKLPEALTSQIAHFPEPVDVVSEESLRQALSSIRSGSSKQPLGIIYCASASKQGGSAKQVDAQGAGNAAKLAKEFGARLVLISALAVDRPASKSFQMTNTLGGNFNGIMDAKLEGEEQVKALLKDYVIIRPGVLLSGKTKTGAADLELNQGDFVGGGLSRDELAGVAVGAFQSGKKGVTVEVYRTSTHAKLQHEFDTKSGKEQYGTSYLGLFDAVQID